ncbi:uncharacterized protein LOC113763089 [Coffea eugenioides]|uniref:uncharacterized protein LOC113763089 n=1 Tax=Coffea eugenioides TaxID=49369 RepID=UPI000F613ED1|nr:uncharacterized protein LOC113763089 [Coffea eugenioides]
MSDSKGDSKQHLSTPAEDPDQEPTENISQQQQHQQQQQHGIGLTGAPFVSAPSYIPSVATAGSFEQQQQQQLHFEAVNPKRPRYTAGQWKLSPSASSQQPPQKRQTQTNILVATDSSPSPTPTQVATNPQTVAVAASSSDTASSPSHSPRPSHSTASGHEAANPEGSLFQHQQFRKGKYVSPVWKPNEMLWLARAWRVQYQGGGGSELGEGGAAADVAATAPARGKTRADKDREVAEFLNRHGVSRDAKTAGTKWDNMLGEFRKVYEWERGGERDQVGKSYFRLSPYERKLHRLPASFDEEVFEELSQFMSSRMRTHSRGVSPGIVSGGIGGDDGRSVLATTTKSSLAPPPPYREEDLSLPAARSKQLVATSSGAEAFPLGGRGGTTLGFETSLDVLGGGPSTSTYSKEFRRIGKIRMIWEESVSLWAEEGEHHRGRVKIQGSSFLNADEIAFLDDSMVACTMEAFEDGPLKGFSVDRFLPGQHVKVFGRRKSFFVPVPIPSGPSERVPVHSAEPSNISRPIPAWEFQDPSDYYLGCLRVPPPTLPSLFELSWHLQEPPPEEFRFPLRKDVYKDLPQGKDLFFSISSELLDCRAIAYDILSPIMRQNPSLSGASASARDSFIGLWDDCVNRIVSKFCAVEMVFVRKSSSPLAETMQDEWPNMTAFVRNFCLWRGEETDQLREGQIDPSSSIVEKLLWTYADLPYVLGYYAVGYIVTFCAMSRSQDRIVRTDLYTVDLSTPMERLKALVPCWRIAGLLPLLADRCSQSSMSINGGDVSYRLLPYSDFERIDLGSGSILEMTPNSVTRLFSSKRRWAAVKEIYDFLDHRIPHVEFIIRSSEKDLGIVFKPRGCKLKPTSCDQLIEALKQVTKALVALHDLSFMHRDLGWEKVMKRSDRENEWFITGFDEAVSAPQIYPHGGAASGRHAPEMGRGLHGVKVDVWGVGQLVKTCGLVAVPKLLRELQNRCLDHNPEQRPTAADCYHHLLQLQSSMSAAAGGY